MIYLLNVIKQKGLLMRSVLLSIILFFSSNLLAESYSTKARTNTNNLQVEKSIISMEGGFLSSSITEGETYYLTAGIMADLGRWITLGVRGNVPIYNSESRESKYFFAEALGRLNILKDANNLYLEGSIGAGTRRTFSGQRNVINGSIGYTREVNRDYAFGLNVGLHMTSADGDVTPFTSVIAKKIF